MQEEKKRGKEEGTHGDHLAHGNVVKGKEGVLNNRLLESQDDVAVQRIVANHATSVRGPHCEFLCANKVLGQIREVLGLELGKNNQKCENNENLPRTRVYSSSREELAFA